MTTPLKTLCFIPVIFLAIIGFTIQRAHAEEVITIEGVMTGLGDNPDEFYALMNQDVYGVGDDIGGYAVVAVDAKGVELKQKENHQTQYYLVGTKIGETETIQSAVSDAGQEIKSDSLQNEEKEGLAQKVNSYLSDIKNTVKQFQYTSTVQDLKRIQFAAMERALTTGNNRIAIQQLIADGTLPPLFQDSQNNGYYFKIMPLADGRVRTSAEPVEKDPSKPYFLIDEHHYVYMEEGRSATQKSPLFSGQLEIEVSPAV